MADLTKPCLHTRRGFLHTKILPENWTNLPHFTKFAFCLYSLIIRNGIQSYYFGIIEYSPIVGK